MKSTLKRLLCAALCAVLLLGCLGTASAAGKKKANDPEYSSLFKSWYYVTSSIPEENVTTNTRYLSDLWDKNYTKQEKIVSCEVTFVSGDEALKDAVYTETSERSDGTTDRYLGVKNEMLTAPGQAVFKIVVESENYRWEETDTLVVIDYNEYPLVEVKKDKLEYDGNIGDTFTDGDMLNEAAVVNTKDITEKIGFKTKVEDPIEEFLYLGYSYDDYNGEENYYERARSAVAIDYVYPESGSSTYYRNAVIKKYGVHKMDMNYNMGNFVLRVPVVLKAEGFAIETFDKAVPGGKVQFEAYGSAEKMKVTWSMEGEGATIDPETGLVTIDADTPMGARFTVKATHSDGREVTSELVLNNGILEDVEFPTTRGDQGFLVPVPGGDWYNEDWSMYYAGFVLDAMNYRDNRAMDGKVYLTGDKNNSEILLEDAEPAKAFIETLQDVESDYIKNLKTEWIDIEGHPVLLESFSYYSNGAFYANIGILWYARNTRILRVRVYSKPQEGQGPDDIAPVTLEDMKRFASFLQYDPASAPFVASDAELSVSAKDDAAAVSAGKTLQMIAAFANPDRVNKKNKNDTVNWSVANAETGEEVPGVTISAKGQLKVDKSLTMPVDVLVKAESAKYGSTATIKVSALPVAGQIVTEPAELFFYVGKEDAQTVKAILTPDTVPLTGITWTPAKQGIVEITEAGDGTISVKPLAAGKTAITVKEPGGKSVKLNVSVVDPVESVELTVKGKAKAGGAVNVTAALLPKTAGNKNVEWSLNVGEDVATINAKGQVKISKEAASGTKITVTCKALGAPEPIVATTDIEIP